MSLDGVVLENGYFLSSKQSELGKSPCNADKFRVVLPVKWLVSNDKFGVNYGSIAIILVIPII